MLRISAATAGLIGVLKLNDSTSFVPKGVKDNDLKFDSGDHLYSFGKTVVTNGVSEIWIGHAKSER